MEQEREMNLFDVCKACINGMVRFFKWIAYYIGYGIKISIRKWWIVLPSIALFLSLALYYARPANWIYEVDGIVVLNGPSTSAVKDRFEALGKGMLCEKMPTQTLMQMLDITGEEAIKLREFKTYYVIDAKDDKTADFVDYDKAIPAVDTLNVRMPNMLALQFRTKDPANIPNIEQKIMAYMNASQEFQMAFKATQMNMLRQHQFDCAHVEKMDSLISAFYLGAGTPQIQTDRWGDGILMGKREIQLFLDDIEDLFEQKRERDNTFALCTAPVAIQTHFTANPLPVNNRLKWGCIGLLVGWLMGCILGCMIEQRKRIIAWIKQ
jgi:hypothetical protein